MQKTRLHILCNLTSSLRFPSNNKFNQICYDLSKNAYFVSKNWNTNRAAPAAIRVPSESKRVVVSSPSDSAARAGPKNARPRPKVDRFSPTICLLISRGTAHSSRLKNAVFARLRKITRFREFFAASPQNRSRSRPPHHPRNLIGFPMVWFATPKTRRLRRSLEMTGVASEIAVFGFPRIAAPPDAGKLRFWARWIRARIPRLLRRVSSKSARRFVRNAVSKQNFAEPWGSNGSPCELQISTEPRPELNLQSKIYPIPAAPPNRVIKPKNDHLQFNCFCLPYLKFALI